MLSSFLVTIIVTITSASCLVNGYNFGWAPPKDKPAPGNPDWTQTLLSSISNNPALLIPVSPMPGAPAPAPTPPPPSSTTTTTKITVSTSSVTTGGAKKRRGDVAAQLGVVLGVGENEEAVEEEGYSIDRRDDPGLVALDYTQCTISDPNAWGLSYDDGPSPYTPGVLMMLQSQRKNATFFVIGSRITENPDNLNHVDLAGMHIGLHTWSHWNLTTLTNDQIIAELVYGARAIYEVTGKVPKFFRPPYGARDDRLRTIIKALGLTMIVWVADTKDWQFQNTAAIVGYMTHMFDPVADPTLFPYGLPPANSISLEHDMWSQSANAAPSFLTLLMAHGRNPMDILHCLGKDRRTDAYFDEKEGSLFYKLVTSINGTFVPPPPSPSQTIITGATAGGATTTQTSADGGNGGGSGGYVSSNGVTGTGTGMSSVTRIQFSATSNSVASSAVRELSVSAGVLFLAMVVIFVSCVVDGHERLIW